MHRLLALIVLIGCDGSSGPPTPPFHRDGSLQFDNGDLAGPVTSSDLAGGGGGDLASAGDLATSGGCATALTAASWDFEAGASGFTHDAIDGYAGDGRWNFDEWSVGTPSGAGPGACHGGTKCFGTYLAGNYASCERAELLTPIVDLSSCAATPVKLVFYHWYDFWTGSYGGSTWFDGGLVELSGDGGATWVASGASYPGTIAINPDQGFNYSCLSDSGNGRFEVDAQSGYVQSSSGWLQVSIAIPANLRTAQFRARFAYSTGVSSMNMTVGSSRPGAAPGWYLDDVAITP